MPTPDKPKTVQARRPGPGLNPELRQAVDKTYSEADHGSTPMDTVSVKKQGPAVWPVIWAVVVIALVLLTVWFFLP